MHWFDEVLFQRPPVEPALCKLVAVKNNELIDAQRDALLCLRCAGDGGPAGPRVAAHHRPDAGHRAGPNPALRGEHRRARRRSARRPRPGAAPNSALIVCLNAALASVCPCASRLGVCLAATMLSCRGRFLKSVPPYAA